MFMVLASYFCVHHLDNLGHLEKNNKKGGVGYLIWFISTLQLRVSSKVSLKSFRNISQPCAEVGVLGPPLTFTVFPWEGLRSLINMDPDLSFSQFVTRQKCGTCCAFVPWNLSHSYLHLKCYFSCHRVHVCSINWRKWIGIILQHQYYKSLAIFIL